MGFSGFFLKEGGETALGSKGDGEKEKIERKKPLMSIFINDNCTDQRVTEEFQEITSRLKQNPGLLDMGCASAEMTL